MSLIRYSTAAAVGALLAVSAMSTTASAATSAETYMLMQEAIAAKSRCDGAISPADMAKMNTIIDEKIGYDLGAGERLTIIQNAKAKVRSATTVSAALNCDSTDVKTMLQVFDFNFGSVVK